VLIMQPLLALCCRARQALARGGFPEGCYFEALKQESASAGVRVCQFPFRSNRSGTQDGCR
jgi:hypothetical protein